jgi:hypothetical protein
MRFVDHAGNAFAVDSGRAAEHETLDAGGMSRGHDVCGTFDVDAVEVVFGGVCLGEGGGQMTDAVDIVDRRVDRCAIEYVCTPNDYVIVVFRIRGAVLRVALQGDDLMPCGTCVLNEMTAEKAARSGY